MKKLTTAILAVLVLFVFTAVKVSAAEKWPSEKWPEQSAKWPAGSEKWPSEKWPTDTEKWPADSEKWPTDSEKWPADSDKWPAGSEKWPTDSEKWPTSDAMSKAVSDKVTQSFLHLDKYVFTLQDDKTQKDEKLKKTVYFYKPQNGPAVFKETVSVDPKTKEVKIISQTDVNRLIGPMHVETAVYEISEIKIEIADRGSLESLYFQWDNEFLSQNTNDKKVNNSECVHLFAKSFADPTRILEAEHILRSAFLTSNGQRVIISAEVSSDKWGPYRRTCKVNAPSTLFKKFKKSVRELAKEMNK